MENSEFLEYLRSGNTIQGGTESHRMMCGLSEDAIRVCMELNNSYHSPKEIRDLFSRLTGKTVDESFSLFPPFYSECGKNIFVGKNVFINFCCHFQDQGGIYIDDGTFIGSEVVVATINHGIKSSERGVHCLSPVHIGKNVWIGSHATILPGVTVGDNSVIAAGAVVTKDIPNGVIAGGVPARILKKTDV